MLPNGLNLFHFSLLLSPCLFACIQLFQRLLLDNGDDFPIGDGIFDFASLIFWGSLIGTKKLTILPFSPPISVTGASSWSESCDLSFSSSAFFSLAALSVVRDSFNISSSFCAVSFGFPSATQISYRFLRLTLKRLVECCDLSGGYIPHVRKPFLTFFYAKAAAQTFLSHNKVENSLLGMRLRVICIHSNKISP